MLFFLLPSSFDIRMALAIICIVAHATKAQNTTATDSSLLGNEENSTLETSFDQENTTIVSATTINETVIETTVAVENATNAPLPIATPPTSASTVTVATQTTSVIANVTNSIINQGNGGSIGSRNGYPESGNDVNGQGQQNNGASGSQSHSLGNSGDINGHGQQNNGASGSQSHSLGNSGDVNGHGQQNNGASGSQSHSLGNSGDVNGHGQQNIGASGSQSHSLGNSGDVPGYPATSGSSNGYKSPAQVKNVRGNRGKVTGDQSGHSNSNSQGIGADAQIESSGRNSNSHQSVEQANKGSGGRVETGQNVNSAHGNNDGTGSENVHKNGDVWVGGTSADSANSASGYGSESKGGVSRDMESQHDGGVIGHDETEGYAGSGHH